MRKILLISFLVLLAACSTTDKPRSISSLDTNLAGHYLGVADYAIYKGEINKAVRLYLQPSGEEDGSYYAILLEYVNLIGMAPKYVLSNKSQKISKFIGFLKNITANIAVYKVTPVAGANAFEMWPLAVNGDQIQIKAGSKPRILSLSDKSGLEHPLSGATISEAGKKQPKIFFPATDDGEINGHQYELAKFTYDKVQLNSTWRGNYLRGDYLSQYANVDDVVLDLYSKDGKDYANFFLNPAYASMKANKRAAMFTNPKSAFLNGNYEAIEPVEGMFLFKSVGDGDKNSPKIIEGRIGLFIDIFDASQTKLKQDVVELALVNTEDPEDFLMYYEHPNNGDGE